MEELRQWTKGKKKSMRFGVLMIWREQKNHSDDCYSCTCKVKGYSSKTRKYIAYPNLPSTFLPIPHGPDIRKLMNDENFDSKLRIS